MDERRRALDDLLRFAGDLDEIHARLKPFGWDSEEELVVLTANHVRDVLNRFVAGKLTAEQIDEWANAIECREDIAIDASKEEAINQAIFLLANPAIDFPISNELAMHILTDLGGE